MMVPRAGDSSVRGHVLKLLVLTGIVAMTLPLLGQAQGRGGRGGAGDGPFGGVGALGQRVERPPAPTGPAPRLPDGTVDLNGVWAGGGSGGNLAVGLPEGEMLPLLPLAEQLMAARARIPGDDPHLWCMPMGVPRSTPYPFRFLQNYTHKAPTHMFIVHEGNIHSYRQIFMDGREHPEFLDPSWYGHSIGSWESKDTLLIDTIGFNDKFWFDRLGTPHTEQLHTIERWTRPDFGRLVNAVTIDDPGAYFRPFTVTFTARLNPPGDEIMEYICQENNQYGGRRRLPESIQPVTQGA